MAQVATRVERITEWITMWRVFDSDTSRSIRKVRRKLPLLWRMILVAGTEQRVQSLPPFVRFWKRGWEPSSPGFWQSPDASATLDGALFNKAQMIDSFSRVMERQMWKQAADHSERYHHRFRQRSQEKSEQREEFHGCSGAGHSCSWSDRRTSPACRWFDSQSVFVCALQPKDPGHQEARIVAMPWQRPDQPHLR